MHAGLEEETILSLGHSGPLDSIEAALLATDDVILVHRDPEHGQAMLLDRLQSVMEHADMPRRRSKDVTLQGSIVGLGCVLSCRPALRSPEEDKIHKLVFGLLDLHRSPVAPPSGFNVAPGLAQRFSLMRFSVLSISDDIYAFVRELPLIH